MTKAKSWIRVVVDGQVLAEKMTEANYTHAIIGRTVDDKFAPYVVLAYSRSAWKADRAASAFRSGHSKPRHWGVKVVLVERL